MQPMLKQILAGGFWTAVKASRAAPHSFLSAAHTPSCHSRIVSTRDMAGVGCGIPVSRVSPLSPSFLVAQLGLSGSLQPVLLPFPPPRSQTWQEVASPHHQPRDGEVGLKLLLTQRGPMGCVPAPLGQPLLTYSGFDLPGFTSKAMGVVSWVLHQVKFQISKPQDERWAEPLVPCKEQSQHC